MSKKIKQTAAWLLVLAMLLTLFPMSAFAVDPDEAEAVVATAPAEEATPVAVVAAPAKDDGKRACEHSGSYKLVYSDSYEATETEGGHRHYACTVCGAEYSYDTDPTVYTVNPKTGEPVTFDNAANPYLPNYEFMPDNELSVFWSRKDGEWRVYAVGSHDYNLTGWCGPDLPCWSAPFYDLSDWRFEAILRDTGTFYASDFYYDLQTDQAILNAFPLFGNPEHTTGPNFWTNGNSVPDAYFDIPLVVGVDGVYDGGIPGIEDTERKDPTLYIAEDGTMLTAFDTPFMGYSGPAHALLAKINEERTDVAWMVDIEMAEGEPNTEGFNPKFYEGASLDLVEVDGHSFWVIVYSYKSNWSSDDYEKDYNGEQRWWPLVYIYTDPDLEIDDLQTAKWHWGGVVGDNSGYYRKDAGSDKVTEHDNPTNSWGNNHGGLVYINGEWYISNHRHTSYNAGRQGFIEKVNISYDNGKLVIDPTEYTSSIGESIDAYSTWSAYIACHLWPTVFSETHNQTLYIESPMTGSLRGAEYWNKVYADSTYADHLSPVVGITDGAEVGFKYLNFGDKENYVNLSVLISQEEEYVNGVLNVYLDAPNVEEGGTLIGSINVTADAIAAAGVTATDNKDVAWSELTAEMAKTVSGVHGVYFVFSSEEDGIICKLDQFRFEVLEYDENTRACPHTGSYKLQPGSREATATNGGVRKYKCTVCGAEYSYETGPLVYVDGFAKQDGTVVDVNEGNVGASNPLFPDWEHVPDGEPHVFWSREDLEWRVYVYGSHDTKVTGYCGPDQVLWSAPVYDLSEDAWRYEGVILDITGGSVQGGSQLFAPDCDYDVTTDTYYMIANQAFSYSVLRAADNPAGPWDDADCVWKIATTRCYDPAIYIENGTIYIAGSHMKNGLQSNNAQHQKILAAINEESYSDGMGQFGVIYQLKDIDEMPKNAIADEGIEATTFLPNDERIYLPIYEGPSLPGYIEELDKYVFLYVSYEIGADGTRYNSSIAYAWTDDLMNGTWHYGENGVDDIVGYDTDKVLIGEHGNVIGDTSGRYVRNQKTGKMEFQDFPVYVNGNNHGGIVKINGEWYFVGHRQTNGNSYNRQAVIGQIGIYTGANGNPVIEPMEFTSSGAADSLDAYETWNANVTTYLLQAADRAAPSSESGQPRSNDQKTAPYIVATRDQNATHASYITRLKSGNVIGYKYLEFGTVKSMLSLSMLVSQPEGAVDGSVDIYLDAPSAEAGGTKLGSLEISAAAIAESDKKEISTDKTEWSWISGSMDEAVEGLHAVYFVFHSDDDGVITSFDQFTFEVDTARTAVMAAQAAQAAAEATQKAAEEAQAKAEAAQKAAEEAAAKGEDYAEEAAAAQKAADAAKAAAEKAKTAAEAAKDAAAASDIAAAKSAAEAAETAAKVADALKEVVAAKAEVIEAQAKAEAAQKAAEEAAQQAAADKAAAEEAQAKAEAAQKAAEEAQAKAEAAQKAAEEAQKALEEATKHDCPSEPFADVHTNLWYHEAIDYVIKNDYMNGMSDTRFAPNGILTRGQLVTILYRMEGEPSVSGKSNPFTDVAAGRFYTNAVIWAASEGIVKGVTDTTYQPNASITREQLVTILYRYDGENKVDADNITVYPDAAQVCNYAKDAINWALEEGVIDGMNGFIQPKATASRAQVATILYRYLEN